MQELTPSPVPLDGSSFLQQDAPADAPRNGVFRLQELSGKPAANTLRRPGSVDNRADERWRMQMTATMQQIRATLAADPLRYRNDSAALVAEVDTALHAGFPQLAHDVRAQLAAGVTGWILHKQPLPKRYSQQLALAARAQLDAEAQAEAMRLQEAA